MTIHGVSDADLGRLLAQFGENIMDPWWRLTSGALYRCVNKDGHNVPFIPNAAQVDFLQNMWHSNILLKARQLGFTTGQCIYELDHAMWVPHQHCGIVAHDNDSATKIFANKVKWVYDNLPPVIRACFPLKKETADQLTFAHNDSYIHVDTSMRSDTINRLHVSEMGKMSAKFPERAKEVETGTLPAVPATGVRTIESTAEGYGGRFYTICMNAMENAKSGKELSEKDWKFFFYPWYQAQEYRTDPAKVVISPKEHEYFDQIELKAGVTLDLWQRAWYISELRNTQGGDRVQMMQEFPSTPEEAWSRSSEGSYFAKEMARARADGRIEDLAFVNYVPVNTFWDIGQRDGTGIWLHQYIHPWHHFLRYIEGWGEPYQTFITRLDEIQAKEGRGFLWGKHYLPHDADIKRQTAQRVCAPVDELREMKPHWTFEIVPRVDERLHGIAAVRKILPMCRFDEAGCKEGIEHMTAYSKRWNQQMAVYMDEPLKDKHTEAPDAFRQFAQHVKEITRGGQSSLPRSKKWRPAV